MAQLRQYYPEFISRGAEVIAIGPEDQETFNDWWRRHEMPFIGLPDPEHSISRLYGQQVKILNLGRMPAQLIVDKKGLIRYVHYGNSMADIPNSQELLNRLDELNRE
jgi:peroxiredoxin Q/BCP